MYKIEFCNDIIVSYDTIKISDTEISFYLGKQKMFFMKHDTRFNQGETLTLQDLNGTYPIKVGKI